MAAIVHNEQYMTNEELFADLKQFITATVSQQAAELAQRIGGVERRIGGVEQRIGGVEHYIESVERRIEGVEAKMATKDDLARVEERLTSRIDGLDAKLDQVQDAIADTLTQVADVADAAVLNHEQHYHGQLKHRAA